MKKLLTIILALICLDSFCQQKEVIACPYDAMFDPDPIAQRFVADLDTLYNVQPVIYDVCDSLGNCDTYAKAVLFMPDEPMFFNVKDSFLLFAQSKGCVTSGIKYWIYADTMILNKKLPIGFSWGNMQTFGDYMRPRAMKYSNDSSKVLSVAWRDKTGGNWQFLSHLEGVLLANYFYQTGYGRLINRKEWSEIYKNEFEDDIDF
jgi:hypothetical protein